MMGQLHRIRIRPVQMTCALFTSKLLTGIRFKLKTPLVVSQFLIRPAFLFMLDSGLCEPAHEEYRQGM